MTRRPCRICRERPAEVPDRNVQGRPIKRVCRQCHAERLRGDLVLALLAPGAREPRGPGR